MNKFITNNKKGFTLVEILLYLSLVGIVIGGITTFFSVVLSTDNKNQSAQMVEQNAIQILDYLTYSIRNSTQINTPTDGNTDVSLSINTVNALNNPTLFDLNSGTIRVTEGANSPVVLSSNNLTASNLIFKNMSTSSTNQIIKFQFTLTFINPDNRSDLNYSKTYYGTAQIR